MRKGFAAYNNQFNPSDPCDLIAYLDAPDGHPVYADIDVAETDGRTTAVDEADSYRRMTAVAEASVEAPFA